MSISDHHDGTASEQVEIENCIVHPMPDDRKI